MSDDSLDKDLVGVIVKGRFAGKTKRSLFADEREFMHSQSAFLHVGTREDGDPLNFWICELDWGYIPRAYDVVAYLKEWYGSGEGITMQKSNYFGMAIGGPLDGVRLSANGPFFKHVDQRRMRAPYDLADYQAEEFVKADTVTYHHVPWPYVVFDAKQQKSVNAGGDSGFWVPLEDWGDRVPSYQKVLQFLVDWYVMSDRE